MNLYEMHLISARSFRSCKNSHSLCTAVASRDHPLCLFKAAITCDSVQEVNGRSTSDLGQEPRKDRAHNPLHNARDFRSSFPKLPWAPHFLTAHRFSFKDGEPSLTAMPRTVPLHLGSSNQCWCRNGHWSMKQKYKDWELALKTFYNPLTLLPKVASKHIISKLVSWSREYPVCMLSDLPGGDPCDVSGKLVRHCETTYWSIRGRKYKNIFLRAGSSP